VILRARDPCAHRHSRAAAAAKSVKNPSEVGFSSSPGTSRDQVDQPSPADGHCAMRIGYGGKSVGPERNALELSRFPRPTRSIAAGSKRRSGESAQCSFQDDGYPIGSQRLVGTSFKRRFRSRSMAVEVIGAAVGVLARARRGMCPPLARSRILGTPRGLSWGMRTGPRSARLDRASSWTSFLTGPGAPLGTYRGRPWELPAWAMSERMPADRDDDSSPPSSRGLTRRGFLASVGGAAVGAGAVRGRAQTHLQ